MPTLTQPELDALVTVPGVLEVLSLRCLGGPHAEAPWPGGLSDVDVIESLARRLLGVEDAASTLRAARSEIDEVISQLDSLRSSTRGLRTSLDPWRHYEGDAR